MIFFSATYLKANDEMMFGAPIVNPASCDGMHLLELTVGE